MKLGGYGLVVTSSAVSGLVEGLEICPTKTPIEGVVWGDPVSKRLIDMVRTVARTPSTVLLSGESGVGKEVFAQFVHSNSKRSDKPFVGVNCAAIPASLLESELFGHERGAFSGATERRIGLFERAQQGTVFLDEITEMPLELQAKLLRVLQERTIVRVGGTNTVPLDVRVIAASNRDIKRSVDDGEFRLDLFYRLNVFPIHIPPLRQRRGDIRPLVQAFADRYAAQLENPPLRMSAEAIASLEEHAFAGNVRELVNIVERAMILASADEEQEITTLHIQLDHGRHPMEWADQDAMSQWEPEEAVRFVPGTDPLTDVRMRVILKTLEHFDGNRTRTAEALGVSLRTIRNKIRDYKERGHDVPDSNN